MTASGDDLSVKCIKWKWTNRDSTLIQHHHGRKEETEMRCCLVKVQTNGIVVVPVTSLCRLDKIMTRQILLLKLY
jgi:hypothetical protein